MKQLTFSSGYLLGLLFCPFFVLAQDNESTQVVVDSINSEAVINRVNEALPVEDTLRAQNTINITNNPLGKELSLFKPTESSTYDLKDHALAAKFDSLWMKELVDAAPLFNEMYQEVLELDTTSTIVYDLHTDTLKLRLARLNERTPFNIEYNASLENVIKSFLTRKRGLMERMLTLSQFYFPLFEQEFDNKNIPLEMKYLSIVESALNPKARSRVGATGLWQFMYGTGKEMKLTINSYVDERSDPIKSTAAAANYLNRLYRIYDDWDLALAAYNSGPGNVNKAIRRSGGQRNYWNIRRNLPRETAGYVPAFQATMYIFEYAEEHGLKSKKVDRAYFETDTVHVKSLITFDQISELAAIDKDELKILNPHYKLEVIPYVEGKPNTLRLPVRKMGKFVANEEAIYAHVKNELKEKEEIVAEIQKQAEQNSIRYRVKDGDFLGKIAERYGVRVSQLKQWNGLRSNNLRIGQRLTIYPRKDSGTSVKPRETPTRTAVTSTSKVHEVKSGDSLWTISRKYPGVTIENLRKWNGISGNNLKLGTKLKLCDCSS
ncbi:LysM peptidoglycan-binding domain-containing protein [Maribacter confluentis]|uniref:LysM peptidoglycan-binding domain-containing protein n=1 Tax=Maribacter confluentis TaxID=1656093 RepID=A0ABT8RRB0_9FLAO|nr:LysM peptidoglycan-binding domain-containing protein [Maribacter confluentis]MDO1512924.1 LysM peptidoglycan-binding domain-containing protein [Maribacter confluentis]